MNYQKRKQIRLPDYDYTQNGAYFITICTHNRKALFGQTGLDSPAAKMVREEFTKVISAYPQVDCPIYVLMPNHFHAIILIQSNAVIETASSLMDIVRDFKSRTTLEYIRLVKQGILPPLDKQIWQRSFYDHVIRNDHDFEEIWKYIEENPLKWKLDRLYVEE